MCRKEELDRFLAFLIRGGERERSLGLLRNALQEFGELSFSIYGDATRVIDRLPFRNLSVDV